MEEHDAVIDEQLGDLGEEGTIATEAHMSRLAYSSRQLAFLMGIFAGEK
jgi:hypothetical protein